MAYSKQTWVRGEKVASVKLNHMEDGIYENSVTLEHGIEAAVDNWLDEHPEATTTVQDGSLTEAKFSDALKLQTIKDYVTPEMFGAVGDGVADDTTAFSQAIKSGNPVYLSGSYLITQNIEITSGVFVRGNNNASIIIQGDGELFFNRAQNVCIDGVTFKQNTSEKKLSFYYSSNITIKNCEFDSLYYAIQFDRSDFVTMENCYVHDCTNQAVIVIGTCHDYIFRDCVIKDNNSQGIGISGDICTNCVIEGCRIEGNGDSVRGSIYAQAINTHGIYNGKIIGNTIVNNVEGIDLSGHNSADTTVPRSKNIQVKNNYISGNNIGIACFSTQDVVIEENYIDAKTICVSIATGASGDFGTQNIYICNNVFGDIPNSSGTYQGVITFQTVRKQVRNVRIERNVFNTLTNINSPYISASYMSFATEDAANLVSGLVIKNNDMTFRTGIAAQNVKTNTASAYKKYPFEVVDENIINLFGTEFSGILVNLPFRKRVRITRIGVTCNVADTKVTFTVRDGSDRLWFDYTNQNVIENNRVFEASTDYGNDIQFVMSMSATNPVSVKIFYTDLT